MAPRKESFRQDGSALSHVVSFLVAGSVFLGAVGTLIAFTQLDAGGDRSAPDAARQDLESDGLADLLVGSAGVGWAGGNDGVERLGLQAANGSGLDQSRIDALKGAMLASAANGKVDYDDAQRSLGIDPEGSQEFHIRMYPVGMDLLYDASASSIRTAYIGDWLNIGSPKVPLGTPVSQLVAAANTELNKTIALGSLDERAAIRSIGLDFTDRVYIASAPSIAVDLLAPLPDPQLITYLGVGSIEGDVYPDQKQYLDLVLANRLPLYDVLVVGSGVDQSTLTANHVKESIKDWVMDGGTLVVLGTESKNFQWLQPLFSLGVSTANGAPTAPDVSHPILKEPHELVWTSYDNHGLTWDIKDQGSGAHYDDFVHVIVQGGEDVFALSKDGAFGEGRIVLTTYMPREIVGTLGMAEASHFVENIALFADRSHLFLEYGPTAPADTPVSVAVRQSWIWDEELGQVPVRVEVQTWG